jgi:hypothetical protein
MSIKLGELLVQNQLITQHQLKEALHAQTIFGGKLGTNLVELGYVNEMDLAKLLSTQLGIPCVEAGDFDKLDQDVLKIVPISLVEKHRVIPLELEGKNLRLAMSDPTNFPSIDEISFATGLRIDPVVAPEILLVYAIEKYYDVARSVRYIRAAGMAQNLAETATAASATKPRIEGNPEQLLRVGEKQIELETANEEMAVEGFPIHQVVTQLIRANNVNDVLEVIRAFVSQDFNYAAVFLLSGETAVGATHVGGKLPLDLFQEYSFPINSSELLFKVWNTREPFHGIPTISGVDHWYFSELGFPMDRPTLCIPVITGDRVTCIILASENKKGELLDMLETYSLLVEKLSYSFEMLYLKKQILDLSGLDT